MIIMRWLNLNKNMSMRTSSFLALARLKGVVTCTVGSALLLLALTGCRSSKPVYSDFQVPGVTPAANTNAFVTLPNRLDPKWLQPPTNSFTLGPGDRLEIELIGETNSNTITMVCPDGKVYFNVLQGVDVWGRTLGEAKNLLEQELANHVRNGPRVSVGLRAVQSQRVWLLGRVQAPGVYPLNGPTTLLEALAGAGGTLSFVGQRDIPLSTVTEDLADLKRSFIIRDGQMLPVDFDRLLNKGDLSQNIYLQTGDYIFVPPATAKDVFVLGAVGQPRSVAYSDQLTLVGAIAGAYGTVKDSYLSQVAIVRGSLAQPQITVVDYNDIVRGRARDIALEPRDIVYVPYSPYRYLIKYAETILNTFASSVAINAGSSLIRTTPSSGGGIFIPVGSRITVTAPLPPVQ